MTSHSWNSRIGVQSVSCCLGTAAFLPMSASVPTALLKPRGISMYHMRAILALGLLLGCASACAQADTGEKNATAEDIQGEWQLLPLPDAMQIKILPSNPWPSECQDYSYARTGDLKSIEKLKGPCNVMSAAQLRATVKNLPAV